MIDDLRAMAIFVKVAEAGSFSAASRALNLSTSVVSHHIRALETRHGVVLLRRSTRALSLTDEGKQLLDPARRMVEAAGEGLGVIADRSTNPSGQLNITLPTFMTHGSVETTIWRFAEQNSAVSVNLKSTDKLVNLIAEGFDLAIRLGRVSDSSLQSVKIGAFERRLVAAPSYLEDMPPITGPKDLTRHFFVEMTILPIHFDLHREEKTMAVHPNLIKISADNVGTARSAVLAGLGLQRLPLSAIEDDLRSGALIHVLPDWSLPTLDIFAAWPAAGGPNRLIKLLLEELKAG